MSDQQIEDHFTTRGRCHKFQADRGAYSPLWFWILNCCKVYSKEHEKRDESAALVITQLANNKVLQSLASKGAVKPVNIICKIWILWLWEIISKTEEITKRYVNSLESVRGYWGRKSLALKLHMGFRWNGNEAVLIVASCKSIHASCRAQLCCPFTHHSSCSRSDQYSHSFSAWWCVCGRVREGS